MLTFALRLLELITSSCLGLGTSSCVFLTITILGLVHVRKPLFLEIPDSKS